MKLKCKHCRAVNSSPGLYCEFCGKETGFRKKKYATLKSLSPEELGKTDFSFPTGNEIVRAFSPKKKKLPIILSILLTFFLLVGAVGSFYYFGFFGKDTASLSQEDYYRVLDACAIETVVLNSTAAASAVNEMKDSLGIKNAEAELTEQHHTVIDGDHYYRLKQTYQGLDVYGRSVIVETNDEGKVFALVSNYCPLPELSLTPGMQADKADKKMRKFALRDLKYSESSLSITANGLVVYAPDTENATLAYSYSLTGATEEGQHQSHIVLLDAKRGKALLTNSTEHFFTVSADGQKGARTIEVEGSEENYQLVDTARNIQVYSTKDTSLSAIEVLSSSSPNQAQAVDALYYTERTYDFYKGVLGRHSFDNNGGALTIIADIPEDNHTFDTASAFGSSIAFYPKASNLFVTSVAPDIVAHEFTHLVLDHTVGIPMNHKTLSVTEGFADVLGNIVEGTLSDAIDETWALGEATGTVKYEMSSPMKYGYGDSISAYNEEADAHKNASILSRAAYLMYSGGETAIKDLNLLGKLWYRAMLLLPQDADFEAAGAALLQSAHDMYRNGTITASQINGVLDALETVGIIPEYPTYQVGSNFTLTVYDAIDAPYEGATIHILNLDTYQSEVESSLSLSLSEGNYLLTVSSGTEEKDLPSYSVKVIVGASGISEVPVYTWYNAKEYTDLVRGETISLKGTVVGENWTDENGETKLSWVLALTDPISVRFMNESSHPEAVYNDQVAVAITSETLDFSLYAFQEVTLSGNLVSKYSDIHRRDLCLENVNLAQ